MSRGSILLLIVLAFFASSLYFLVQAEGGFGELPRLLDRVDVPLPSQDARQPEMESTTKIPSEFTSGDSRFSQGTCQQNSDCQAGGCSGEVCHAYRQAGSSEAGVITTCEYREDFPSTRTHTCECVAGVCGWQ